MVLLGFTMIYQTLAHVCDLFSTVPLCSWKLHGVGTEVLNRLKHCGGLWAWP